MVAAARSLRGAAGGVADGKRRAVPPRAADLEAGLRGLAIRGICRRLRQRPPLCPALGGAAGIDAGGGIRAAVVCPGRGLSVRFQPRGRRPGRGDDNGEGGPPPPVPQPDAAGGRLSARDPGDGVRRARPGIPAVWRRLPTRHLRQHVDGGGDRLHRQEAAIQPPLSADVFALSGGADRLHAGGGLGEGPGREPGRQYPRAALHPEASVPEPAGAERLARRPLYRRCQDDHPPRDQGVDDLGGVRGRASGADRLSGAVRRLPRDRGERLQDQPGPLRPQPLQRGE